MLHFGWARSGALTAGLTTLCALWWIFEPIPIPATSMIPLGVFPLLGILDGKQVAQAYGDPLIILLDGWRDALQGHGEERRSSAYRTVYGQSVWWPRPAPTGVWFYGCLGPVKYVGLQYRHHIDVIAGGLRSSRQSQRVTMPKSSPYRYF